MDLDTLAKLGDRRFGAAAVDRGHRFVSREDLRVHSPAVAAADSTMSTAW